MTGAELARLAHVHDREARAAAGGTRQQGLQGHWAETLELAAAGNLPAKKIRSALERAGLAAHEADIVPALMREAADHAQRVALERRELLRLEELSLETIPLPLISGGIDLGGLYQLAELLAEAGVR